MTLSSFSSALICAAVADCDNNGALLELVDIFVFTLLLFNIPSKLMPLSALSKQFLAVVVVILLLTVDVIKSLVPLLRIIFGGSVRSLTESFLPF